MFNDLRLAIRSLSKNPRFAAVVVLTLALGIGASTTIFSVVHGVLLRPLPYPHADRLVQVQRIFAGKARDSVSFPDFEDLQARNHSFAEIAAYDHWAATGSAGDRGFRVALSEVSPDFLSVLDVDPASGRTFSTDEARSGRRVAIVSYAFWRGRLAGRSDFGRRPIRLDGEPYTVIGVMPPAYDFPAGTEIWVPRAPVSEGRKAENWRLVGRLRAGVSIARAQQDLSAVARGIEQQFGDDTWMQDAAVRPLVDQLVGDVRPALWVLLGAVGVLLLIACVNVANLLLARGLSRDRESALRVALGARPGRLARGLLAESMVLAVVGGALGVGASVTAVPALLAIEPGYLPRVRDVGVDGRVLAFSLVLSVLTALAIGLIPAVRGMGRDPAAGLGVAPRIRGGTPAGHRARALFVIAQIALTVVLLVGGSLLARSFLNLLDLDPGYRTKGVLVMDVWLPTVSLLAAPGQPGDTRVAEFIQRLIERLRAIPGVEDVGAVNRFPLEGGGADGTFVTLESPSEVPNLDDFERLSKVAGRAGNAEFRVASTGYFGAMNIPLVAGRLFDERDSRSGPQVAVISESLAKTRWPAEKPIGKVIAFPVDGDFKPLRIIGVVGDVREYGLGSVPRPTLYADYLQRPRKASEFHVAIRGSIDRTRLAATARRIAHELGPERPEPPPKPERRRLCFAGRSPFRALPGRAVRRSGTPARRDRGLWRDRVFGRTAYTRDWRPPRTRCDRPGCSAFAHAARNRLCSARDRDRLGRGIGIGAVIGRSSVRHRDDRPRSVRSRGNRTSRRGAARKRDSGISCFPHGSHGSTAP